MLELVDLDGAGDREPRQLSGGQQQRVALARALAPGPDVLLLDEPLSALDARLRERLRVTVRDIQQELDITTVYVTHDQAEALAISDRVAVVHDGAVEQVGTPETVYHEPSTRFVAEFVGDNNVFEAEVSGTDPPRLTVDGASLPTTSSRPVGTDVTACVRPENITLGDGDGTLSVTVDHVEFLGDAYRLHCEWRGRTLLAKTEAEPTDRTVTLGIDADDVYVL
jgi:thiamine transport system ATP-binding protein